MLDRPGPASSEDATAFPSRLERFAEVGSTNDVVAGWLAAGEAEVCVAVADRQTAGRGRSGRIWTDAPEATLLLSAGFRPTWLSPDRVWRLAAIVALAMADAAEDIAGMADGAIRLKWPNDLVVEVPADEGGEGDAAGTAVRKLAGLLGETSGLGTAGATAVVGIGLNADWPAADFPPDLAAGMTSLRVASGGRPIDREALLAAFLDRLATRHGALRDGHFDVGDWASRQLTDGRLVRLDGADGGSEVVRAIGVDSRSGALLVEDPARPGAERAVVVGEIRHLRLHDGDGV